MGGRRKIGNQRRLTSTEIKLVHYIRKLHRIISELKEENKEYDKIMTVCKSCGSVRVLCKKYNNSITAYMCMDCKLLIKSKGECGGK